MAFLFFFALFQRKKHDTMPHLRLQKRLLDIISNFFGANGVAKSEK